MAGILKPHKFKDLNLQASLCSSGKEKKGPFMLSTAFPLKVATLPCPWTPANLPPPFFHTWLIRTPDYSFIKGWSPHFCSHRLLVVCLSLLPLHFTAVPTLLFHPRWQKGIQCHPIMNLCVVQKHSDARPSVYVWKNKYSNHKLLSPFLTQAISGAISRCVKMFKAPACNKVWKRLFNLET